MRHLNVSTETLSPKGGGERGEQDLLLVTKGVNGKRFILTRSGYYSSLNNTEQPSTSCKSAACFHVSDPDLRVTLASLLCNRAIESFIHVFKNGATAL